MNKDVSGTEVQQGVLEKGKQGIVGHKKGQNFQILGQHGGKLGHPGTTSRGSTLRQSLIKC